MKSPVHRCRDVEHGRRQPIANCLQPEQRIPIPKDVITSSSASAMWFIRDACGIVCAVITWLLVLYAEFVVLFVMLLPTKNLLYSIVNGTVFNSLAFLALASHLRAMCTDPGAVPKGNATKEYIESLQLKPGQVVYKCPKCCSIKPDRAHHCSVCKRCIRKMDHHCPWVNNCVGENNQKYFVLFTMYIALISLHTLVMVVFHFLYCFEDDWTKCSTFSPPATVILLILLCFEGLLFLIFTSVMFGTQVHSICTDETVALRLGFSVGCDEHLHVNTRNAECAGTQHCSQTHPEIRERTLELSDQPVRPPRPQGALKLTWPPGCTAVYSYLVTQHYRSSSATTGIFKVVFVLNYVIQRLAKISSASQAAMLVYQLGCNNDVRPLSQSLLRFRSPCRERVGPEDGDQPSGFIILFLGVSQTNSLLSVFSNRKSNTDDVVTSCSSSSFDQSLSGCHM